MKKSKVLYGLCSIILSAVLMVTVFSSSTFKDISVADVKIEGVSGQIDAIRERLIRGLNGETSTTESVTEQNYTRVYVGGFTVGLKLYADGVVVVGTEPVDTERGYVNTAEKAGLKVGDIIKRVNGEIVATNSRVSRLIEESNGNAIELEVLRDGQIMTFTFNSEYSVSEGKFKAGIWVRDSSAGIGTVTFCTKEGLFASLGHAVCDIDTKDVVPISQGECTSVNITGYTKGTTGTAGELCGVLESEKTGDVYYNGALGVYGEFHTLPQTEMFCVAPRESVKTGEAYIYTTLENNVIEKYSVKIKAIDYDSADNKNLVIEVTDQRLLDKTGGIIQGMSGSPIVQGNMLVGAVTHVFLNDSTGGYGIFAETMLETALSVAENEMKIAS